MVLLDHLSAYGAGLHVGAPILPATAEKFRAEFDFADSGPDAVPRTIAR
jgi:hypothetical protein